MMLKRKLFSLIFCLFAMVSIAQDSYDTSIMLAEISINSYRFEQFAEGSKRQNIDSTSKYNYQASTVAEALNSLSTLSLKSYGISGNTSISLRGTSSAHTAVLWNGISLQDPLNGGTNLELIPLQAIDEIVVQYGGSGALFGSGAIGGAIIMQSKAKFQTELKSEVNVGFGSFGNFFGQASIQKGGKKAAAALRFFYRQAENDFPFKNTQEYGHPETKQSNAAVEYYGLSQDSRFSLAKNQQINTHFWFQKSTRELPPNMTSLFSNQVQTDEALRFTSDYSLFGEKTDLMARVALLSSKLIFNDSLNGIFAEHRSQSALIETEVNYRLRANHLANIGIHERIDWGKSDNFAQLTSRNNLAVLLSYKIWNPRKTITVTSSIRQELIDKNWSQPTPSLGINYKLGELFQFSGKIARNYRQPTFNDLFWNGGFAQGNPDLLAESAWAQDLAARFYKINDGNSISISLSLFNTYIKNMILWIPIEGIWIPMNQKEVWSRGIETDFTYKKAWAGLKLKFDFHYSYNPSTIEKKAENETEAILNKQLVYSPKQQAKLLLSLNHHYGNLSIEQMLIGKRYTVADNSASLNPYALTNIVLSTKHQLKNQNIGISFRLNNLFNQDYQSMNNYALPGRNYQLSIHYNFN